MFTSCTVALRRRVSVTARVAQTVTALAPAEAQGYSLLPEERYQYVRVTDAKVNLSARTKGVFYHLASVNFDNAAGIYDGDNVQAAEPWSPPETMLAEDLVKELLDVIDVGLPNGQRYSPRPNVSKARRFSAAVRRVVPEVTEDNANRIKDYLLKQHLIEEADYVDSSRNTTTGLYVVNGKVRPLARRNAPGTQGDFTDDGGPF
jgi:hypothetical protein